jgi:hypothetical protein
MLKRRSCFLILAAVAAVAPVAACSAAPDENAGSSASMVSQSVENVHLKAFGGQYLGAQNNGGGALMAVATEARDWETFSLLLDDSDSLRSGDEVFIRTGGGQYFQAENGGGAGANAASQNQLDWETFRIVKVNGGGPIEAGDKVALQAKVSGKYLSAIGGGGQGVNVQGEQIREWETFTIEMGQGPTPPPPPLPPEPPPPSGNGCGRFTDPTLGPNVCVFDASASMTEIQSTLDGIANQMEGNEFGDERYAIVFKPGAYSVDVKVGFYTQVLGLGAQPDDVMITGAVRARSDWWKTYKPGDGNEYNATHNFWRGIENLAVKPTLENDGGLGADDNRWHVSQATHVRRLHVLGNLSLSYGGGWCSGGFIADSKVDGAVKMKNQQQWLTRNSDVKFEFSENNWNTVFVGVTSPPDDAWPSGYTTSANPRPISVVAKTPRIREKPFLRFDSTAQKYVVTVPKLATDTVGASWTAGAPAGKDVAIDEFFVAKPGDTAQAINAALELGKNVLFTPGLYKLEAPIRVTRADTVLLGLGLATLTTDTGMPTLMLDDVDGISVAGILLDAGSKSAPSLLEVGPSGSARSHATNPTALFDVHCRVGGPDRASGATTESCVALNSKNVIIDHMWLWRADHGTGPDFLGDWNRYKAKNGITVNGDDVTAYALFVEHFQEYQTYWKGNNGEVYFYQSELPYEAQASGDWVRPDGTPGYPSFKVADSVTKHKALALGTYAIPLYSNKPLKNLYEAPNAPGVSVRHMIGAMFWHPGGVSGSGIQHIFNGQGDPVAEMGGGSFFPGK